MKPVQLVLSAFGSYGGTEVAVSYTHLYNLILAGCISQMVVWEVCRPMNMRRRILCIAVGAIFVTAIFLFPGFFSITGILNWRLIFIIPLVILTGYLMNWLTKAVRILTKVR